MKRLLTEASLIMKPEGQSDGLLPSVKPIDGSGDFTFTRGSNLAATRIDRAGLIEKGRENLLLQSNQFDTTWLKVDTNLTSNQSGYDGTNDAWLLTKSAPSAYIRQVNLNVSGVQTFSVYAKANTSNWLVFLTQGASAYNTWFDLQNGIVGGTTSPSSNLIDANIESVGSGWYRCSITINGNSVSNVRIYPAEDDLDTSGTSGSIYIQDAQLEQGLAASPYIPTTTTTAQAGVLENTPRLNYTTGVADPYLLLEPSRTNLVPYSEYFDVWNQIQNVTLTANSIISPSGESDGTKFLSTTGSSKVRNNFSAVSGTTYTLSVYCKNIDATFVRLLAYDGLSDYSAIVTSEINTSTWTRVSLTFTATNTSTSGQIQIARDLPDGESLYFWGAQLEAGAYATSYIPNHSGGTITRGGDAAIVTGASSLIGQTEGTLFIEFEADENIPQNMNLINFNNSTQASVLIAKRLTGQIRAQVFAAGVSALNINSVAVSGTTKVAFGYKSGDSVLYVNGVALSNSTTFTFNGTLSEVKFPANEAYFNYGHKYLTSQALVFNTRLSDSDLETLTTI